MDDDVQHFIAGFSDGFKAGQRHGAARIIGAAGASPSSPGWTAALAVADALAPAVANALGVPQQKPTPLPPSPPPPKSTSPWVYVGVGAGVLGVIGVLIAILRRR